MVGDRREYFTKDGLAAMKWELTRAAIDNAIQYSLRSNSGSPCCFGNVEKGYLLSPYHSDGSCSTYRGAYPSGYPSTPEPPPEWNHYRLPAIPEARSGRPDGTITVEDVYGKPTGEKFDAWDGSAGSGDFPFRGLYRKWYDQIEKTFSAWDEVEKIPYERNFWDAADQLRSVIKKLEVLNCQGESYYLACSSLGLIETYSPGESAGPPGRMWAPQINGPIDLFVIPLQGTFLNLAVFAEMLAAQLEGLGNMWQNARQGVMEIGWYATQRLFGRPGATDLKELIHGAGYLLASIGFLKVPTPVSIGVAAAGIALTGAEDLIGAIQQKGADVAPFGVTITAGSTEHVLEQVQTALYGRQENCLQEALESDEGVCIGMLQVAQRHFESGTTVYNAQQKSYSTVFTLKPGNIRGDTAPGTSPDVDIKVEFDRLRKAGSIFADELSRDLHDIASSLRGIFPTSSAWERPEIGGGMGIGIGWNGPWDPWNANRNLLVEALEKTALQAAGVGDYLISAANFLERQDASAQEALEQAGAKLDGQFGSP